MSAINLGKAKRKGFPCYNINCELVVKPGYHHLQIQCPLCPQLCCNWTTIPNSFLEHYKQRHYLDVAPKAVGDGIPNSLQSTTRQVSRLLAPPVSVDQFAQSQTESASIIRVKDEVIWQQSERIQGLNEEIKEPKAELQQQSVPQQIPQQQFMQNNSINICQQQQQQSNQQSPPNFIQQNYLQQHVMEQPPVMENIVTRPGPASRPSFNCCGKIFTSRSGVWRHRKEQHGNHKFKCDKCNFVSKRYGNVKRHTQKSHDVTNNAANNVANAAMLPISLNHACNK